MAQGGSRDGVAPASAVGARRRWVERGFVAYAVVASSVGAAVFAGGYPELAGVPFWRRAAWQFPPYMAWALLLPAIAWTARRLRARGVLVSTAGYMAAGLVLIPAHALFTVWWIAWGHPSLAFPITGEGLLAGLVQRLPIDLLMYCAIVGALYARDHALRFGEEKARAARLENELLAARLEALKARVRPHFLFNTLQSITVLIRRDPEGAVRMTWHLATLLRHSLETAESPLVTLDSELELLERYVAIEEVRFKDRLAVVFEVDPRARQCLVPDLLLQPLVENAIRHGIARRTEGGTVWVRARLEGGRLCIEVCDDGAGLPQEPVAEGVGLGVIRSRLRGFYGTGHAFSLARRAQGGTVARLEVPASGVRPGVAV